MLLDTILANLSGAGDQITILLLMTVLDLLLGVIVAVRAGIFKLEKLAGVLESDLLPILGWVGVVIIASIPQDLIPGDAVIYAPDAAYGLVFIKILGSILGSISSFGVGTEALTKIGVQVKQLPKKDSIPGGPQ